jgi:hypothetical protein
VAITKIGEVYVEKKKLESPVVEKPKAITAESENDTKIV